MTTIRENLEALIAAVEAEPENLFRLNSFVTEAPCGTLHCTLGLAATLPRFYEQGLALDRKHSEHALCVTVGGTYIYEAGASAKLDQIFGVHSDRRLFACAEDGTWDGELMVTADDDKQLALARLRRQLELYP